MVFNISKLGVSELPQLKAPDTVAENPAAQLITAVEVLLDLRADVLESY